MTNTIPAERTALRYPTAPYPDRDIATIGDNGGVRFLFDLAFGWCYPAGDFVGRAAPAAPADGALIRNIVRQGEGSGNGSAIVVTENGSSLPYLGGGFDLGATTGSVTYGGNGVAGPAAALADIWAAAPAGAAQPGAAQRFLWVGYFKLPTTANWGASGSIRTLFSACAVNGGYASAADILNIAMRVGSPYQVDARRQVAAATLDATTILQPAAGDYGSVVQLAYWRNGSESAFRLKSDVGTVKTALAAGADNTQNFSALVPVWGHPLPFNVTPTGYSGVRVYRGWIENLARSGRTPDTVLDADWEDVVRRAAFC